MIALGFEIDGEEQVLPMTSGRCKRWGELTEKHVRQLRREFPAGPLEAIGFLQYLIDALKQSNKAEFLGRVDVEEHEA
jgi:hypothetical protein